MPASAGTRAPSLLFTCEHGGHEVPGEFAGWFAEGQAVLSSHRGWDAGALPLARSLASWWNAPLEYATVTRLLVDLNRSPHNPRVWSEFSKRADPSVRAGLLERYHRPYRERVMRRIADLSTGGSFVLHVSVHTFTPELNGAERSTDVGVLFDPRRAAERSLAADWLGGLRSGLPHLTVHRNQPYRGRADGFTSALRRIFPDDVYAGVELEVNQKHLGTDGTFPAALREMMRDALSMVRLCP